MLSANRETYRMASASSELDEQIQRLRKGDTLAENEVKALCDKVSNRHYKLFVFQRVHRNVKHALYVVGPEYIEGS